jgi:hypothetical protein
MKYITTTICVTLALILITLIVFTPKKCDHEEVREIFSFQPNDSTAASYMKPFCKSCNKNLGYSAFRGTPKDKSYLEAVKEHIAEDEIIAGEYYTMSATVALEDYDVGETRISCKVENEDVIVGFSVEFREEYEKPVSSLQEGDKITFRGRLYDDGFGFTDCELMK